MSETETKVKEQVQVLKDCGNGQTICLGQFEDGAGKGLKYAYPQIDSGAAADAVYGKEETANLLNAILKLRVASKVKTNKFPRNVDAQVEKSIFGQLANTITDGVQGLIFGVEEALSYKPGERVLGAKKQIDLEINNAMALMASGGLTPEKMTEIFQKIQMLKARLDSVKSDE